ncbi:MAG: DUF4340 domain-containing protein [Bacteroidetes bacterium]|jgi:hypothetical protein|nr:DUF4340 domain-containing protein [Bacteroidota bacterium]MDF1865002.1 DUF4340 domain-containing protein [Saprospiraceae bacterium]
MNNKTLLIIFVALLAVYGISQMGGGKKDRSFNTELVKLDTASITRIVLYPKADDFAEVSLSRETDGWIATKGNITTKALANNVNSVLAQLDSIGVKRIAAKKPEKWAEYEVNEKEGTRLQVYAGSELLKDFIIGRFAFNQQTRQATSFVRLTGEDEVFAVDGFLAMSLGQSFDAFRNKELIKLNKDDVMRLSYKILDNEFNLNKSGDAGWLMDGELPIDSTTMDNFINGLSTVSGTTFVDDFDPVAKANTLQNSLTINANNLLEPLTIHCYVDASREKPFIIHSSLNKDAYFESDSTGIYNQLFLAANEVIAK